MVDCWNRQNDVRIPRSGPHPRKVNCTGRTACLLHLNGLGSSIYNLPCRFAIICTTLNHRSWSPSRTASSQCHLTHKVAWQTTKPGESLVSYLRDGLFPSCRIDRTLASPQQQTLSLGRPLGLLKAI
jgi:hypothetical protein